LRRQQQVTSVSGGGSMASMWLPGWGCSAMATAPAEALTAATLLPLLRRRFFAVLAGFIDSVIVATYAAKSLMSLKPLLAPRFYPFGRVFERYAIADEHREYDRQYNPAAIRPVATCAVCDGIDHDHYRKNKHEQSPYQQSCDAGPANTVVKIFP